MKNISGIYQIRNKIDNKIYIGSAINLKRRKGQHFHKLIKNKHCNKYLQFSFNKNGKDNFLFEIIEYTKKENLIEREQYYIDILNPEYNVCKIAGNNLGLIHSEETKTKLSEINKGKKLSNETKQKMSNTRRGKKRPEMVGRFSGKNSPMYGKHLSEETKDKIRISKKNYRHSEETKRKISTSNKGKVTSQETRKKLSLSKRGEKNPFSKLTEDQVLEIVKKYNDGARKTHLSKEYGVCFATIHNILNGKIWSYLTGIIYNGK